MPIAATSKSLPSAPMAPVGSSLSRSKPTNSIAVRRTCARSSARVTCALIQIVCRCAFCLFRRSPAGTAYLGAYQARAPRDLTIPSHPILPDAMRVLTAARAETRMKAGYALTNSCDCRCHTLCVMGVIVQKQLRGVCNR